METVFLSGQPHLYMRVSAVLVVVLLSLLAVTGAAAQPAPFDARQDAPVDSVSRPTTVTIELQQDGDARWNVTTRFPLTTENETAAFRRVADDFEKGRLDTTFSTDVFETLADRASERTGRPMEITDVARTRNATNTTGRLTLTFTWTNFARTSGSDIVLGDVFRLESGTWLPSITDGQRLVIRPPDRYGVDTSPNGIGVNNGVIDVNGSHDFSGGLNVEYVRSQGEPPNGLDWSQLPVIVVLVMAMGVGGLGVYVWTKRQNEPVSSVRADGPVADEREETDVAPAPAAEDDEVREELLSDEERVERLIAENGGRMMQADIVKDTNWSNAKVSQLLSAMDEDGRINKLRIGRENLITFPDEDVTDIE